MERKTIVLVTGLKESLPRRIKDALANAGATLVAQNTEELFVCELKEQEIDVVVFIEGVIDIPPEYLIFLLEEHRVKFLAYLGHGIQMHELIEYSGTIELISDEAYNSEQICNFIREAME